MSLQVTTPPTAEPVTVDEVKDRLRLSTSDDDAQIAQNITAAREFAETATNLSLVPKSYALTLDRFYHDHPRQAIALPSPLVSVDSVTFYDETMTLQTLDPDDYFVAPNNKPALVVPIPGTIWPPTACVPGAVTVKCTAGYGALDGSGEPLTEALPGMFAEGIRQLAVHIYEHPEAVTSEGLKEIPLSLMRFFGAKKVYSF
jgi:uncharacterized phiE125 gp8 family phage protein